MPETDLQNVSLEELTETAMEEGDAAADQLVEDMVDEGVQMLNEAGIQASKPLNTEYSGTDSFDDAIINGWAGKMDSYGSQLSIKGREVTKNLKNLTEALDSMMENLPDEEVQREDKPGESEENILEKNAFNTTVHELWHYNQNEELVGEVLRDNYSAEAHVKDFKKNIFDDMYEWESHTKKPSSFMRKALSQEFKYPFGVLLSGIKRENWEKIGEELGEHYKGWKEAEEKTEEIVEDIDTFTGWIPMDQGGLAAVTSDSAKYDRLVSGLENTASEEKFEDYIQGLEEIIEQNRDNYDEEEHYTSPEEILNGLEEVKQSKDNLIDLNKEKEEYKQEAENYITDLLERSNVNPPVTKAFKEAFAHLSTLALQGDLQDPEERQNYLQKVEEAYNSDMARGYEDDDGSTLRSIAEEVLSEYSLEGTTEEQLAKIHDIQAEYADRHRIPYA